MGTCSIPFDISGFSDLVVWPTGCFYYFWLVIFGVLFAVIAWALFLEEKNRRGEGEILSSLGVSATAIISIALAGTFIKNSLDMPMIQTDIFLWVLAPGLVFILIWIFSRD